MLAAWLLAAACPAIALADDAADANLTERFYADFNAHRVDTYEEYVTPGVVDHNAPPGSAPGIAGLRAAMSGFFTGSSDIKVDVGPVVAKDGYVVVYSLVSGTHDGDMFGTPASGKRFAFPAIDIWLVKDGKLAEAWHVEDMLGMMAQIGALNGQ